MEMKVMGWNIKSWGSKSVRVEAYHLGRLYGCNGISYIEVKALGYDQVWVA
jgi:hypothetical protein